MTASQRRGMATMEMNALRQSCRKNVIRKEGILRNIIEKKKNSEKIAHLMWTCSEK